MNIRSRLACPFLCCGWLLLALAYCRVPAARAAAASKAALIDELFTLTHADTLVQQTIRQGMATQRSMLERAEPFKSNKAATDELVDRMAALLTDKIGEDKLRPTFTKFYAGSFTEDELSASLAFYKSSAGQAMLTKLPTVTASKLKIVQQMMIDLQPEIHRLMQDVTAKYQKSQDSPAKE